MSPVRQSSFHRRYPIRVWEDSNGKREVLQVVVPTVLRKQVFGFLHDSKTGGHFGVNKTIGKIRMKFY